MVLRKKRVNRSNTTPCETSFKALVFYKYNTDWLSDSVLGHIVWAFYGKISYLYDEWVRKSNILLKKYEKLKKNRMEMIYSTGAAQSIFKTFREFHSLLFTHLKSNYIYIIYQLFTSKCIIYKLFKILFAPRRMHCLIGCAYTWS